MSELIAINIIKDARKSKELTQKEVATKIAERLGQSYSLRQYQKLEKGKFPKYKKEIAIALEEILEIKIRELIYNRSENNQEQTDTGLDGIIYVPIAAQAEYPIHFQEPLFIKNLQRVRLPGPTYQGEQYRIFEVNDDSMDPYYKQGDFLMCNRTELTPPIQITDYGLYTVVRQTDIVLRWLAVKDDENFVLLSLNTKLNRQALLPLKDIKELWRVTLVIRYEEPIIKKFNIEI